MVQDVVDLRDFYASSLGQVARRLIRARLRELWPDVRGLNVLGLGYAVPYLGLFRGEAQRVLAAMPASQGVLHWPADGAGLAVLTDDGDLPFPDLSMDRVLLVHALEGAEPARPLLREVWRVLAGSGRLVVVVPNRSGIWARIERTPFGHGRPYTPDQLGRLLRDSLFTPVARRTALFVPPVHSRMVLSSARAWESMGSRFFATFAGAVVMEATKQIYAGHPIGRRRAATYLPIAQRTPRAAPRISIDRPPAGATR